METKNFTSSENSNKNSEPVKFFERNSKEIELAESPFSPEKIEQMRKELSQMIIAEAIEENPELADKLTEMGFGCVGCACSDMETLEDGIAGHGLDVEEVMEELSKNNNKKNEKS